MDKRTENNIGQNNKTSVKVHYGPGGASSFSLGWEQEKPKTSINKYHNQSNVVIGGQNQIEDEEQKKRKQLQKKKKEQELNAKLPSYDPKQGHRTNISFGDNDVHTSVKIRNPPGGRSNIQFG